MTSIDTQTPRFSPDTNTIDIAGQTITDGTSTVTTVLPIPPVNIEIVPNQDILMINQELIQIMANHGANLTARELFNFCVVFFTADYLN